MVAIKVLCNDSANKSVYAPERWPTSAWEEISRLCFFSVDMTLPLNSFSWGWAQFLPLSLSVYCGVIGEGNGALHRHMGLPSLGMAARLEVIYGLLQVMFHHWLFFPHQILHHQPMNIFFWSSFDPTVNWYLVLQHIFLSQTPYSLSIYWKWNVLLQKTTTDLLLTFFFWE